MTDCYSVRYDGPLTAITSSPGGPWPRWHMARAAAIQHLEETVAECQQTLMCLRRAGSFYEYMVLRVEMEADQVTD